MTDADVSGYNMSAAMMGGFEYSILLREDGNVEFVMAGANIPSLTWSYGKVPTDSGRGRTALSIDISRPAAVPCAHGAGL